MAVEAVRAWPPEAPLGRAVRASDRGHGDAGRGPVAGGTERRRRARASPGGRRRARRARVVSAASAESWAECLRLAAAAARLRDETGYRWRFAFEHGRLDAAVAAATDALGPERASAATAEGAALEWREAAAYASRARGERQRPSHGWAALTPTELQVVALASRRPHEPTDRRATPHGSRHGEDPPRPRLHQDRPPLTDRTRR